MSVVGSAYVTLRLISDRVGQDIRDAIEDPKNKKQLEQSMDKMFKGLEKSLNKGNGIAWKAILGVNALGPAVAIIGAYIAQAISLLATLGPAMLAAAGAGAVLAGSLLQVKSVFSDAFKVKTDMLERYTQASKALKKSLAEDIQKNVLPAALGAQIRILPLYRNELVKTSAVIGNTITSASKFAASPLMSGRIKSVFSENTKIITIFAGAVNPLINIFVKLLNAAAPIATRFAQWAVAMIKGRSAAIDASDAAGRLSKMFEGGAKLAAEWGKMFGEIGKGLFNIFKIALPSGGHLLDVLSALTAHFQHWTERTKGKNELAAYFNNARIVVHEVNGLISDLFDVFKRNSKVSTGGLVGGIEKVRTTLIPVIDKIVTSLHSAGPGLATLFGTIGNILQSLASSGALGTFATTLNIILNILNDVLKIPVVGTLVGWGVAFLGVGKAMALFPGGSKLFVFALKTIVFIIQKAFIPAIKMLGKALLTFVLENPIIALVVVIVGGLILMYMKFKWFRDFVQMVLHAIADAAVWLWQKGIQPAWDGIKQGLGYLGDAFKFVWAAIKLYILIAVTAISLYWKYFLQPIFKEMMKIVTMLYRDVVKPVFHAMEGAFKSVGDQISWVWNHIIKPAFDALGTAGSWLYNHVLKPAFQNIVNDFHAVGSALDWAWKNVIKPVFDAIVRVAGTIAGAIGKAFSGIATIVGKAFDGVKGVLQNIINFFISIVNDVIHLIDKIRIHVPKVPGIGGGFDIGFDIPDIPLVNMFHASTPGNTTPVRVLNNSGKSMPQLAEGGVVGARPGGTIANIAEAGRNERIEPLDSNGMSKRDKAIFDMLGMNLMEAMMALAERPLVIKANSREIAKVVNDQNKAEARR